MKEEDSISKFQFARLLRFELEKEYNEIFELANFCNKQGVEYIIIRNMDGFQLIFHTGDVIQHMGSYGSASGCVEFGYTGCEEVDFVSTQLNEAKEFILTHRTLLNSGESELFKRHNK